MPTSYPGTVTPLRGLSEFTEAERDVFFGRDAEREKLAELVTGDSFRAGLLFGDIGTGKSSLLRAGLIPQLRDHGVVALLCDDLLEPARSFAASLSAATGQIPPEGETPLSFLATTVSRAMKGQQFVFIVDNVDQALAWRDERVIGEYADLFARVVTRSSGRARFLFCCPSDRIHLFGSLERRAGSLFPPSSRYELRPMPAADAAAVLDQVLGLGGVSATPDLATTWAQTIEDGGPIRPADIQIAALAARDLGATTPQAIEALGGARQLAAAWIDHAAHHTGDRTAALRLVAELALGRGTAAVTAAWAAARAGVEAEFATQAFRSLRDSGVVAAVPGDDGEFRFRLAHEVLAPPVQQLSAIVRDRAKRAYELLGSKAEEGRRLNLREWAQVKRERLAPSTPEERSVLDKTRRFYGRVAAGIGAALVALLIIIYFSLSGRYYLDLVADGDSADRVVVRKGRSGLSAFHWLPGGFGDIVAETGLTTHQLTAKGRAAIADNDVGGSLDDDYAAAAWAQADPRKDALLRYATDASEDALAALTKKDDAEAGVEDTIELLGVLGDVARGTPGEIAIVNEALESESPAVQAAALAMAARVTARRSDLYENTLTRSLTATDTELRRLAFSAVSKLEPKRRGAVFAAALSQNPGEAAKRELLAVADAAPREGAGAASAAVSILRDSEANKRARAAARDELERAFLADAAAASLAASNLVADESADTGERIFALGLLRDHAPEEVFEKIASPVRLAVGSGDEKLRNAAIPVNTKLDPSAAIGDLAVLIDAPSLTKDRMAAVAGAWGEVGKQYAAEANGALAKLITNPNAKVRAAAARAYGKHGRAGQGALLELIKKDSNSVAIAAAHGLAYSAATGGRTSTAVSGIAQLWKKKGALKRHAARAFAEVANSSPKSVMSYLSAASRDKDDRALHPIGTRGLCNAIEAGYANAARSLERAAANEAAAVRRSVISCAVRNRDKIANAVRIAKKLIGDSESAIRLEAARLLADALPGVENKTSLAPSLIKLAHDDERAIRMVAIRALPALGSDAPEGTADALVEAFNRGDVGERAAVLSAARTIGVPQLVPVATADPSPTVRLAALDLAIATNTDVGAAVNSALTDSAAAVRRGVLAVLESGKSGLPAELTLRALAVGARDPNPVIAEAALRALARTGDPADVQKRLAASLADPSERVRARAARAASGLADGSPQVAIDLLEPQLSDPSHDVRAALVGSLGRAYAAVHSPDELAKMLRSAERDAPRRAVLGAALFVAAKGDAAEAAAAAIDKVAESANPLARATAKLVRGLLGAKADGLAFLSRLSP